MLGREGPVYILHVGTIVWWLWGK